MVSVEADQQGLEAFVAKCLTDAGVWLRARESDGIPSARVVETSTQRLQICGRVYTIDQVEHGFSLDIRLGSDMRWQLYFDIASANAARGLSQIEALRSADELEWRVLLSGVGGDISGLLKHV
jgi:hypothetical protein